MVFSSGWIILVLFQEAGAVCNKRQCLFMSHLHKLNHQENRHSNSFSLSFAIAMQRRRAYSNTFLCSLRYVSYETPSR